MFSLNESHQYYFCVGSTDMRKGFDTLSGLVRNNMQRDPTSGEVFLFINGARNTLKLLHWESGGFVIYHKRLERGRFSVPVFNTDSQSYQLSWIDLVLIIEGICISTIRQKKRYKKA